MYFLVKSYRDNYLHGYITYGQAVGAGVVIFLYYSIIMAIFTYILYAVIDPELTAKQLAFTEEMMVKKRHAPGSHGCCNGDSGKIMKPGIMAAIQYFGEYVLRD